LEEKYILRKTEKNDRASTRRILDVFLKSEYNRRYTRVISERNTNLNESFNSLISSKISKSKSMPKMYFLRVLLAVVEWNGDKDQYLAYMDSQSPPEDILERLIWRRGKRKKKKPSKNCRMLVKEKKKKRDEKENNSLFGYVGNGEGD